MGCLAGALVAAGGIWLAIAYFAATTGGTPADPEFVRVWLPVIGAAGILAGLSMALWLDHSIAGAISGYLAALRSGQTSDLRDLPAASGWGDLSALGEEAHAFLTRAQQTGRAFEELTRLQRQLDDAHTALQRWNREERWQPMAEATGPFGVVTRMLNEGLVRHEEVREQNREAARQIRQDLDRSLDDARLSAEQTERGFVEATSLLTTVRELQRLSAELGRPGDESQAADPAAGADVVRQAAADAVGELVQASGESIRHLSNGLLRVREVADQVQILGNRATLMALNVMIARPAQGTDVAELKALAAEVRASMDRVAALTRDVESEVDRAGERMKGVRERVAASLDRLPSTAAPPRTAAQKSRADLLHALERVREMIQDATVKGERLSSAGESASRAAERLVRHLEESTSELEALVIRLEPAAASPPDAQGSDATRGSGNPPASLRLLDADDEHPGAARPRRENRP